MKVIVLEVSSPRKQSALASVTVELADAEGNVITIDDLRNRQGQLWLAVPSYSLPASNGRSYDYLPAVILSAKLKREVEDAVLRAFEVWEREQSGVCI